jgi:glycerol-3-phosphate dehydrogenase subunit C
VGHVFVHRGKFMTEGTNGDSGAPVRHPIEWSDPDFYDREKLDSEMRRVFNICHGCRRCFNLCDSFPRLFDLVDASPTFELDGVSSTDFKSVVDACTLCDMCFMTKCPYVPPHEFNIDFPHLMVRYRACEHREGKVGFAARRLADTDANGRLAGKIAPLANWASNRRNKITRGLLRMVAGVHADARLPEFHAPSFEARAKKTAPALNCNAPAFGRKAVIYATCFVNYNNPGIGEAARAVLAKNGVETEVAYPKCCGMPQFEQGDLARVEKNARTVCRELLAWVDKGYDVVIPVPSCALMIKLEWPLLMAGDEEIKRLSKASFDVSEYVVDIMKNEGLADGLGPLPGGVTLHVACHARAQNMGVKAADMLRGIPELKLDVIERCSGHGGSWGVKTKFHDIALKVGRPVAKQVLEKANRHVASECPLAASHVIEGMDILAANKTTGNAPQGPGARHPIELLAEAYGLSGDGATR